MMISDLSYLETFSEKIIVLGGAATAVGALAEASGNFVITQASTETVAKKLSNGGSLAIGIGYGFAISYDINNAAASVDIFGGAEGDIATINAQTSAVGTDDRAIASGTILTIGITLPKY